MRVKTNEITRRFREEWFQFNTLLFFILICAIAVSLLFIKKNFILDQIAAFEILNERGDSGILSLLFGLQYLSVPIFYLWKLTISSTFLWISSFFFGYRLYYAKIWKLMLMMEIIFVIPEILKIIWFMVVSPSQDYEEITAFYPFSLLNFFDFNELSGRWIYPLKALNLFEVILWFLLLFGVHALANKKLKTASLIVLLGYVVPFLTWLVFYLLVYK